VRRLRKQIGTVDSRNANSTVLKAGLDLSMRHFQRRFYIYRKVFWLAPVVRRCFLDDRRVWSEAVEANGHYTGEAIITRLKAALDVSRWHFQRSFYTYRKLFWPPPVARRCILGNRRVGGLLMRIGDANFTQLNTPLNLSIRRFQRRFYTYRRQYWLTPVARRCILEDRHVWRLYGSWDGDANFTRLNARLNLSIRRFQRSI
jgi:hypothetical protein